MKCILQSKYSYHALSFMKICQTNVDLDVKLFCASNVALKTIHIEPKWQLYDNISRSAWDTKCDGRWSRVRFVVWQMEVTKKWDFFLQSFKETLKICCKTKFKWMYLLNFVMRLLNEFSTRMRFLLGTRIFVIVKVMFLFTSWRHIGEGVELWILIVLILSLGGGERSS